MMRGISRRGSDATTGVDGSGGASLTVAKGERSDGSLMMRAVLIFGVAGVNDRRWCNQPHE
jgi:hypothetical protein